MNDISRKPHAQAMEAARARWNAVAKPLGALGELEAMVVKIAGIAGDAQVDISRRAALIFCADHGVVAEGVTQSPSQVTAVVAESMVRNDSNINHMAAAARADVFPIDVGMLTEVEGMICRKSRRGTANMTLGPAMTRQEAEEAIQTGIDFVGQLKAGGYRIAVTGEMGIGNTTASTAIACAILGIAPQRLTGRGAGLSDAGLMRKVAAIERALAVNRPRADDAVDVLSKVGGLEIAAMAGAFLGGMAHGLPVVIDGTIAAAAALVAHTLCPAVVDFVLPSHMSREGAAPLIMEKLGLRPVIFADLALGEGTGAVMLLPILDMTLSVYGSAHTFHSLGMEPYTPKGGRK